MKTQIMLDLETLGNKPYSVITSIGAVKFEDGEIKDTFYLRVDPQTCVDIGLKMEVSTVLWWMEQNDAARKELTSPATDIWEALLMFSTWLNDKEAEIWGNGATFDNVLLSNAYEKAGITRPWKYSNDRCYRTLKNLYPYIELERTGVEHNALDDAKTQAIHLMKILQYMNDTKENL